MKKNILMIFLCTVSFLFRVEAVAAEDWKADLALTADQQQKLHDAGGRHRDAAAPTEATLAQLNTKLRGQVDAKASAGDLRETVSEIRQAREKIQAAHLAYDKERGGIFSPQQEAKVVLKESGMSPSTAAHQTAHSTAAGKTGLSGLGLSADQKLKLRAHNEELGAALKKLKAERVKEIADLKAAGPDAAPEVLAPLLQAIRENRAKMAEAHNQYWDGLSKFLDGAQEAKLTLMSQP